MITLNTLYSQPFWIFDMDGTLTIPQHDFDHIRKSLGLPKERPILESLNKLPKEKALKLHKQLDEIELTLAKQSQIAQGAHALLHYLTQKNYTLAILTRNNRTNIEATLHAIGLRHFFQSNNLLSRDCAPPKPNPAGIHHLCKQWHTSPEKTVMLGDHFFDLETGRAAGSTTVYINKKPQYALSTSADYIITNLTELIPMIESTPIYRQ